MINIMKTCKFGTCNNKHDSHGYCANHARQYRKYGHPLSQEEISRSISERNKGNHYVKGKTWAINPTKREKMKGVRKNTGRTHFVKGFTSWNKGKKDWLSKEQRAAISLANTKYTDIEKASNKVQRMRARKLRNLVFARDNDTCQVCFASSDYLQADHIKSWAEYPELRFELDNLRTLCMPCHYYVTYKRKLPQGIFWGHRKKEI